MRLYITQTGKYVGTQADAKADGKNWHQVEVPTDKPGLIEYLNALRWSEQARAVAPEAMTMDEIKHSNTPEAQAEYVRRRDGISQSIALDDAWEALPLARKLHFAALAMEDARNTL